MSVKARRDDCKTSPSSPRALFTCNKRRLHNNSRARFFLSQSRGSQNINTTSASRLMTLGSDQQVGLDHVIAEFYNKVGDSSRAPVQVVSLFSHTSSITLTSSPIEARHNHAFQHSSHSQTGYQGYYSTNLCREMPLLTLLSPCRPGWHDVGWLC